MPLWRTKAPARRARSGSSSSAASPSRAGRGRSTQTVPRRRRRRLTAGHRATLALPPWEGVYTTCARTPTSAATWRRTQRTRASRPRCSPCCRKPTRPAFRQTADLLTPTHAPWRTTSTDPSGDRGYRSSMPCRKTNQCAELMSHISVVLMELPPLLGSS